MKLISSMATAEVERKYPKVIEELIEVGLLQRDVSGNISLTDKGNRIVVMENREDRLKEIDKVFK